MKSNLSRQGDKILFLLLALFSLCLLPVSAEASRWVPAWRETTPLTSPRTGAAAVAAEGVLYILGGADENHFLNTTEYARIEADGSLGPWQPGPMLNEARGHFDAVVYNGAIYVVGGAHGDHGQNLLRSVERSVLLPDGSMGPWVVQKNAMNMPRRCAKTAVMGRTLYAFGGYGGDMLNTVEHTLLEENGAPGEWLEEGEKMTALRYISGVKAAGNRLYVAGGHHQTGGVGMAEVEWASVIDEAGFGRWMDTAPLQVGRYGLALALKGSVLYALGGNTGHQFLASIERADIHADGTLSPWRYTTPLNRPRATFASVVHNDRIYVMGGSGEGETLRSVEYASFNEEGEIGFRGTGEEAARMEEQKARETAKIAALKPDEGIVLNVVHTPRFTYLELRGKENIFWLAAPVSPVKIGDSIRYGQTLPMSGFYSRELGKTFSSLLITAAAVEILDK